MTVALVFFEAAFIRMDYHLNSRIAAVVRISPPGKCKHGKVREWDTRMGHARHEDGTQRHKDTRMERVQGWDTQGYDTSDRDNLVTAIVTVGTLISSFSIALS